LLSLTDFKYKILNVPLLTFNNLKSFAFLSAFIFFAFGAGGCGTASDTTIPETTLSAKPTNPSNSSSATFEFQCDLSDCSFECRMDSDIWSPCSSPANYPGLANGSHSFKVRALNSGQMPDPTPEFYIWTIAT